MNSGPEPQGSFAWMQRPRFLYRTRFLSVSIAIHVIVIALLGGIVLFQSVDPVENFLSVGSCDFLLQAEESNKLENPEMEFEDPGTSVTRETSVTAASAIISLTTIPSAFQITTSIQQPQIGTAIGSLRMGVASMEGKGQNRGSGTGSLFGMIGESRNGLVGYMYDLKQTRTGQPNDMALTDAEKNVGIYSGWQGLKETDRYNDCVKKFVTGGWNENILSEFFRARKPLTVTQILIPKCSAALAPEAFQVKGQVSPRRWLIHYKGTVRAPKAGAFRFVGYGDDVLVVRFAQRNVLEGSLLPIYTPSSSNGQNGPGVGQGPCRFGEWFEVQKGSQYPVEVLIGESPGGYFSALLYIQEKGVTYPSRSVGGLALPVFQTSPTEIRNYVNERSGPAISSEPLVFASSEQ